MKRTYEDQAAQFWHMTGAQYMVAITLFHGHILRCTAFLIITALTLEYLTCVL